MINYPSKLERIERGNYEYKILLLLKENKFCRWNDFLHEKVKISESSLSKYFKKLIEKNFINKLKQNFEEEGITHKINVYKITSNGLKRLGEIESIIEEDIILPPSDIDFSAREIVLWMLSNNTICQWKDFINSKVKIPRATLSNTLNRLIEKDYIERILITGIKHAVYKIKPEGRKRYIRILKNYGIDRQTIKNEKLRRIKEISVNINNFFQELGIKEFDVKHRFTKYELIFDYPEFTKIFRNEMDYKFTLLYMAINHPDNYPTYISREKFCQEYNIKNVNLNYYLSQILDTSLSEVNIFYLKSIGNSEFFFHEKEKIGKMLKAIVEDYIEKKFDYVMEREWRKFNLDYKIPFFINDLEKIIEIITIEHSLFHKELKPTLIDFLSEYYINYLDYKLERKQEELEKKKFKIIRELDLIEFLKASFDITEIPKKSEKLISRDKIDNLFQEIKNIDKPLVVHLNRLLKNINDLLEKKSFNEALIKTNEALDIFSRTDEKNNFYKNIKKVDENYYLVRLIFYYKTFKALKKLKKFKDVVDLTNKAYSLQFSTDIIEELIDDEQFDLANKIFENILIDPYNNYSEEELKEAQSVCLIDVANSSYNKINDYLREGDFKEALKVVAKYKKFYYDPIIAEYEISALIELKRYEKALKVVNNAIEKYPNYLTLLPSWKFFDRKYDFKLETQSGEEKRSDYRLWRIKIKILIYMKKYEEALQVINKVIEFNPNVAEAYLLKSIVLMSFKKHELAIEQIDKAIQLDDTKFNYYQFKAKIFLKYGDWAEVIKQIDKAIELNPENLENYQIKAETLIYLNHYKEALEIIKEKLKDHPNYWGFYEIRSLLLRLQGKSEDALDYINKAIELGSDYYGTFFNKAQILRGLERYDEALESIEKAIELDPNDPSSFHLKITLLYKLGRHDEALRILENSKKIITKLFKYEEVKANILNSKSLKLASNNQKEEAINSIQKAIELDSDFSGYFNTYGEILMIFKDFKAAIEKFEKAKKLRHTPIKTYINLGKCLIELVQYEQALKNLEIGKYQATHSVKGMVLTKDGRMVKQPYPQTELIKETEKYISEIKNVNNNKSISPKNTNE